MSKGTVVIGGGSGFIGSVLSNMLQENKYKVLIISRKAMLSRITWEDLNKDGLPSDCSAVINLAGQNVLDPTRRWTPGFQQNVYASRVNTTLALSEAIKRMSIKPKLFASISGVGFYKADSTVEYTEESPGGDHGYFSKLCNKWEAANQVADTDTRRVVVRSGIVLGKNGGMIKQLYWPFFFGLGGPISSGQQYMPWIHVQDIAGIFLYAVVSDNVKGILNGVAPQLVTNKQFAAEFGKAMKRPALIPTPKFALDLAFGPERSAMMTEGQKVMPKRTLEMKYKFRFPDIASALRECAS